MASSTLKAAGRPAGTSASLHGMGVICGLAAGVWLGAAEAPAKLVNAGFSPLCCLTVHGGWRKSTWSRGPFSLGLGSVSPDSPQLDDLIFLETRSVVPVERRERKGHRLLRRWPSL